MPIEPTKAFTAALAQERALAKGKERRAVIISVVLWLIFSTAVFLGAVSAFGKGESYLAKLKNFGHRECVMCIPLAIYPTEIIFLSLGFHLIEKANIRLRALERAAGNSHSTFEKLQEATNVKELANALSRTGEEDLLILEEFQMSRLSEEERNLLLEKVKERGEWEAEVSSTEGLQQRAQQGLLDQFDEDNTHLVAWVQERIKIPTETTQAPVYQ